MIHGLDVSNWQPEKFPLELPDGTPVDFVIIQVTRGMDGLNEKWPAQAAWARENGLAVGFYHFGKAADSPDAQARRFSAQLGSLYPGETLWYDWENSGTPATAPSNEQKDIFIKTLKALRPKKKVGLYCNVDFWKNRDRTDYAGDGLWIASWRAPNSDEIVDPPIQAEWVIHQYDDGPGVDHDRAVWATRERMKVWGGMPEDPVASALRALLEVNQLLARAFEAQQERILALQTDFTALASGVRALVNHADVQANLASSRFDSLKAALDVVAELTPDPAPTAADVIDELARRLES